MTKLVALLSIYAWWELSLGEGEFPCTETW